jgi:hypothetical protein
MAEITIPQREIDKVKNRFGPYRKLDSVPKVAKIIKITDVLLPIIENAFREYAKAHKGCTKAIEDKAWKDFLSKLKKYL